MLTAYYGAYFGEVENKTNVGVRKFEPVPSIMDYINLQQLGYSLITDFCSRFKYFSIEIVLS